MKVRIGLRASVIVLFLGLYLSSLIVLNAFFVGKQKLANDAFKSLEMGKSFAELSFLSQRDSLKAMELLNEFHGSLATSDMVQHESQIYSAVFLFLLLVISVIIFIIIFNIITKPLNELRRATSKIGKGDFSIQLPETGIKEIKDLKSSFNSMSRELDSVQKKLLRAEKEMIWKELSRILAHEIKNPLTPIQLSIQRLEEKYELDPVKFNEIFPESVRIINQEINNLQKLARSFSSFAKNINPEFTRFDAVQIIKDILISYTHKYNISFECDKEITIEFDQTHFYQIITNILQNAIDASEEAGKMKLAINKENTGLLVSISDEGQGIPPENLQRIFEPYFTKKKKGTGLGLALVKKLVDVNNARIEVESKLNEGTTFNIYINSVEKK
jgi:two-component system, NtrC family, nitrogen regulation sensor histidine kinase NtrY